MIINIPIEPLDKRYTIQWNSWFKDQLQRDFTRGVITIDDIPSSGKIESGSFLDTVDTNRYKTKQLLRIIEILENYNNEEPLVLFFHDIWFPGMAVIGYIRDGLGYDKLKICGCLHSGGYDATDFIRQQHMNPWTDHVEKGWFSGLVDKIYVATHFHKDVVDKYFDLPDDKVEITGFPLYSPQTEKRKSSTGMKTLVFPHRLVPEKRPEIFDQLAAHFKDEDWNWVKTMEYDFSKPEYYRVLVNSDIAISAADHENWGIGMQEATLCGAIPLVPNRLSYPELFLPEFIYKDFDQLIYLIEKYIHKPPRTAMTKQKKSIIANGGNAIPNIIQSIKQLIE